MTSASTTEGTCPECGATPGQRCNAGTIPGSHASRVQTPPTRDELIEELAALIHSETCLYPDCHEPGGCSQPTNNEYRAAIAIRNAGWQPPFQPFLADQVRP